MRCLWQCRARRFSFEFAYQPIVDVQTHQVFAHEALVRGPQGEGAASVLAQVNELNRYRFDQACRVKAIKGAKELGMTEHQSINFLPNAIYKPELCIRTTLEAARVNGFPLDRIIFEVTEGERIEDGPGLRRSCASTSAAASKRRLTTLVPGMRG